MGNACGVKADNKVPNPTSGLTDYETNLVRELWIPFRVKPNLASNGITFFLLLFNKHPYLQDYFPDFIGKDKDQLKDSIALRAHAVSVFVAITSYVDCLDDPPTMVALMRKRVLSHHIRGVTFNDMENLKEVLLEYLKENAPPKHTKTLPQAIAAWSKFLSMHNAVYQTKVDEIIAQGALNTSPSKSIGSNKEGESASWTSKLRK